MCMYNVEHMLFIPWYLLCQEHCLLQNLFNLLPAEFFHRASGIKMFSHCIVVLRDVKCEQSCQDFFKENMEIGGGAQEQMRIY